MLGMDRTLVNLGDPALANSASALVCAGHKTYSQSHDRLECIPLKKFCDIIVSSVTLAFPFAFLCL